MAVYSSFVVLGATYTQIINGARVTFFIAGTSANTTGFKHTHALVTSMAFFS